MTLATINSRQLFYPGACLDYAGVNLSNVTVDAAGEYYAVIFCAAEAMSISHVVMRLSTVTGGGTLDVRIETVDGTGFPTGTLWAANTNNAGQALTTNPALNLIALTAAASIAIGDIFAVVFRYNSGTSVGISYRSTFGTLAWALPYRIINTGTPTKAAIDLNTFAVGSSASEFYCLPNCYPFQAMPSGNAFNNTNNAKRAVRFQIPFRCRARGILIQMGATTLGDYNYFLEADDGTLLASGFHSGQQFAEAGFPRIEAFNVPAIVEPGSWYRLGVEPTTSTNVAFSTCTLPSANYLKAWPGGANFYSSVFASGIWTDDPATVPNACDLWIDQLDYGKTPHTNLSAGLL